ncbi:MAG: Na+ dependent nucleoside transporter N-terminal domain-containing protein [Desulfobacterales bacterium]|jgi:CNT family concentrative nucleoside transporter
MIIQSIAGLLGFAGIAWLMSENRKQVKLKRAAVGIVLQVLVGLILLKIPFFRDFFLLLNRLVLSLEEATTAGTSFVFGYLGGADLPFTEKFPGAGFILAFRALPLILIISALSALMFYWKILPMIVKAFSSALQKTMGLGGTEGVGVSVNIFVGMVESPLFIRPYLQRMTRSEIFTLMTSGMATIAGTVMVLYASILRTTIPDIMGHILTASIISVPAAITISKLMVPETDELTPGELVVPEKARDSISYF